MSVPGLGLRGVQKKAGGRVSLPDAGCEYRDACIRGEERGGARVGSGVTPGVGLVRPREGLENCTRRRADVVSGGPGDLPKGGREWHMRGRSYKTGGTA
jgi:hypothetical protein